MYTVAHSTDAPAMLILFAGRDTSDREYEGVVRAWQQLYRNARGRPAVGLVVVPAGHAQPNAHWRRRFAEVHGNETAPMEIAVVTESALIRGVITAVNWLMRSRANCHSHAFSTVDAAAERLCSIEGMTRDTFRLLLVAAQKAMTQRDLESRTAVLSV